MGNKPKVMILHNIISPYRLPIFEELSKKYDLTVYFCKANNDDRKWSTKLKGYSCKYKVLPNKDFGPFVINSSLNEELKKNKYDVFVCFENPENYFSLRKVIKFAKHNQKRVILVNSRRNDEILSLRNLKESKFFFNKIMYRVIQKIYFNLRSGLYLKSNSFVSYCNQTTDYLINNKISKEKIFTGTQIMPESLLDKPTKRIKSDKIRVFHLGYLREDKGVQDLIKAFRQINNDNLELIIAGSGNYEDKLKDLAKNDRRIKFVGYADGLEKANLYANSDMFVFPTLHDSWGLVVNEAFYYGLPVISSKKAGAIELINEGKTGLIVPDRDVEALKVAMGKLIYNKKLLNKMKENVKKIHKSKIVDINKSVKTFENAINHALRNQKEHHDPHKT